MEKKYVLERSRLRGLVVSAIVAHGGGNKTINMEDVEKLIDEYATPEDEVE